MTNNDFVSVIINDLNSINKDDRISRRYILSVGNSFATTLIEQRLSQRKLFRDMSLYKTLRCFELEQIDSIKCDIVEFKKCGILMKSKKKLPKLFYSRYGNSIQSVTSIDEGYEFSKITPRQYRLNKNRRYADKFKDNHFYYVKDGYLYIPDVYIEAVDIMLMPKDTYEMEKLSGCNDNKCLSVWDMEFIAPDSILNNVISLTYQTVAGRKRIVEDENPNLDSNIKSATIK